MKIHAIIRQVIQNLTRAQQRKGVGIILLMVLNALLDFFSVAAFLPLVVTIVKPGVFEDYIILKRLYNFLGFSQHRDFIIVITVLVFLFVVLKNIISLLIARTKARFAFSVRNDLSSRALSHYMNLSYLEFTHTDFTKALHRVTNHPLAFANNIILAITTILSEGLVGIFIIACMAFYNLKLLLFVSVILLPVLVIFSFRKRTLKKISDEIKSTYPALLKDSGQIIEGFVEISAYQKKNFFYSRFQQISERLTKTFIKDQTLQAGTLRITEILVACVICSLTIYATSADLPYQTTLLMLGIYGGASYRIVPSVNRILNSLQQIRTNEYVLEELKVQQFKNIPHAVSDHGRMVFNDSITLNGVSFQYPDGNPALDQISMSVKRGQRVAIRGASGEGKSTLLLVLLGFLKPSSGELRVDGKIIEHNDAWLQLIGYVAQNPYMLDGTVADNIAFGISPENIDRRRVQQLMLDLKLDDIDMEANIGERGVRLSGGQRQRVAIARALYTGAEILVLDEITNQVHDALELEILTLLNNLSLKKKTVIIVTHKTLRQEFLDAAFVLDKGKLYETVFQN